MTDAILVMYGRIETKADEYLVSSGVATRINSGSLIQEKEVSWDDLSEDVIAELMLWENASAQDLGYIEGLAE